jgi:hypothetical protein
MAGMRGSRHPLVMPIEGLPDPERHVACLRCLQWFETHEGRMVERTRYGAAGGIAAAIRAAAGDSKLRFICARCEARSLHRFAKVIGALLLLIGLFWISQKLGWP